jgi:hypothetical protein
LTEPFEIKTAIRVEQESDRWVAYIDVEFGEMSTKHTWAAGYPSAEIAREKAEEFVPQLKQILWQKHGASQ